MIKINDSRVKYIKPVGPVVKRVYWNLGNICPYTCSYCPASYNSGTVQFHDIELILQTMHKLDECVITFGGGEPTYHPDFERIINEKPKHIRVGVSSNLARPYDFWRRVVDKLTIVMSTFHIEFAKLDRFIQVADLIYLKYKKQGQITLVMVPEKWDECVAAYNELLAHNLPVSAKPILNTIDSTEADSIKVIDGYTESQLNWMTTHNEEDSKKFMGVYSDNDELIEQVSIWGLLSAKQSFAGWLCYTPMQYLCITKYQEVYDQSCNQRTKLGTLTEGFTIPTAPVICRQSACWCTSDIVQKKEKINGPDLS